MVSSLAISYVNVPLLETDGDVISELTDADYTVTITSEGEGLNTTFDVSFLKQRAFIIAMFTMFLLPTQLPLMSIM